VTIHARIAQALGWTEDEVKRFSFAALRELLRPAHPKLVHELDNEIRSGIYLKKENEHA
jgi:hypothetical protein